MSAFDAFPLGQPAFVSNILDRAAHLRTNEEKLFALEQKASSRAYVVYRDSLLVKREGERVRALLSIEEALKCGANPGTIFLGLRDGDAVFGMGMPQAAAYEEMKEVMATNAVTCDAQEGMTAFLEKRSPVWQGR